jgi:hypothetical protein
MHLDLSSTSDKLFIRHTDVITVPWSNSDFVVTLGELGSGHDDNNTIWLTEACNHRVYIFNRSVICTSDKYNVNKHRINNFLFYSSKVIDVQ